MSKSVSKSLVASATALLSISCFAGDINWSGFMSVVGGKTLDENTRYNSGFNGYNGGVYENEISFEPESMIGLQGQAIITDKLRATVQILGRAGEGYDTSAEWAYISYGLNDEWTINAGKFRLPLFYYSDFLDVGYAYHWVRPPSEVYFGPSGIQGLNAVYSSYLGDIELTTQFWYGNSSIDTGDPAPFNTQEFNNNTGINVTLGYSDFKFRVVYNTLEAIATVPTFLAPPAPAAIAIALDVTFQGATLIYDNGSLLLMAEFTETELEGLPAQERSFASAAYNFGDFTPHFTIATGDANPVDPTELEVDTKTIGIKWDFHSNAALKLEYSKAEYDTLGLPGFADEVKLISAAIDIVF